MGQYKNNDKFGELALGFERIKRDRMSHMIGDRWSGTMSVSSRPRRHFDHTSLRTYCSASTRGISELI